MLGCKKLKNHGDHLVRIDIGASQIQELRMPKGIESTANDLWLPGGKTSNGQLEAVIDAVPWSKINNIQIQIIVK